MADVFISYSHVDSTIVDELATELQRLGVEYFLDRKDIEWGGRISETVSTGLRDSGAILVVVSPASLKSAWVPYEIGFGTALRLRVMPFLTHPSLELPGYISDLKHLSSISEVRDFFETNIDDINRAAQARVTPDVRVYTQGFVAQLPTGQTVHGISINAANHSDQSVFLMNFRVELPDRNEELLPPEDHVTKLPNGNRELKPGDSYSIQLLPDRLLQNGITAQDLGRPLVRDKIGRTYYGSAEQLRSGFGS